MPAVREAGLREPSLLWWLPDEIEAEVSIGHHEQAEDLTGWIEERARAYYLHDTDAPARWEAPAT